MHKEVVFAPSCSAFRQRIHHSAIVSACALMTFNLLSMGKAGPVE